MRAFLPVLPLAAALAVSSVPAHAAETVFLPGADTATVVEVLYLNRADAPATVTPAAELACPGARRCVLIDQVVAFELAPASARLLRYRVAEPEQVLASAPEAVSPAEAQARNAPLQNFAAARFAPYEPMYFLFNGNGKDARFQFSFRYQLFDPDSAIARRHPWLAALRFAYTQTSLWDLSVDSNPFYDTSYKPELFFEHADLLSLPTVDRFDLAYGFRHESNGKDGDESRDLNQLFVSPTFTWGKVDGYHLVFSPVFASHVSRMENNPDIAAYRGHADWRLRAGDGEGLTVGALARFGTGGKAGAQLDVSYPLRGLTGLELFAYLQYWKGYSETLRTYDRKTEAVRIGVGLVR